MSLLSVIESDFEYRGFRCVTIFNRMGFRCGYVGITKNHKFYGKDYTALDCIACHGGLTYSDKSDARRYPIDSTDIWWIGFDCGHYGDGNDYELVKEKFPSFKMETNICERFCDVELPIRTLEYVQCECKKIVDQII